MTIQLKHGLSEGQTLSDNTTETLTFRRPDPGRGGGHAERRGPDSPVPPGGHGHDSHAGHPDYHLFRSGTGYPGWLLRDPAGREGGCLPWGHVS